MPRFDYLLANTKALYTVIALGVIGILLAGSVILDRTATEMVKREAERNGHAWSRYVGAQMPHLGAIAKGTPPSVSDILFLSAMRHFGDVFRFKLFDSNGRLALVSDDLTVPAIPDGDVLTHNPRAASVLASGNAYSQVEDGSKNPDRPDVYVETYVPVIVNGRTEAVVELYVDQTLHAAQVRREFVIFGFEIVAIVIIAVGLPLLALIAATRSLRAQKADLEIQRDRAQASERAKAEFLANMSHEVRTPLNGVLGMAGLILDTRLSDVQRQYTETIVQSGEALLGILNDILDFSKIEAGKLVIEPRAFQIVPMLDSTVELFALRAHAKNLEIPTYIDADIPESLIGDEGRIRQIMLNLISNAIKFTEDGGIAVEVSVSVLDARNDRTVLHFAVTDTGIGIPDDKLESIFKQFEQADGSTTRQYGGTGLGLAICKNLVTLMGGEIGVEQRPEGGSVFWSTVPFERPEAPESWSRDLAQSLNGRRVLVVDDNAVNRLVFERQLSALGANVTVATGAESAVRKIGQDNSGGVPFDLIIIDHMMPGTDGLDLAEIIRALPGSEDVRLVLSSSSGQFNSNAAVHKHGFDAALPKPLRPGALIRCIGELDNAAPASRTEQSLAAQAPPPDEMPDGTPAADGVLRILVAEDNQINQMLITSLLKTKGYVIDLADNGAEAVDMLRSQPYDIVLMDIQMPELDGIAATRIIRAMDCAKADIPIVAVSAHAMQSNRNEALGAGMNDYLTKPIDKNELFEKVARWAPSRAMPDDAAAELRQRTIAS